MNATPDLADITCELIFRGFKELKKMNGSIENDLDLSQGFCNLLLIIFSYQFNP